MGSVLSMVRRGKKGKKLKGAKRVKHFIDTTADGTKTVMRMGKQEEMTRLHNYVIGRVQDDRSVCARIAQLLLVEAYRRGYWRDAKTANVLAECVFHKVPRIKVGIFRIPYSASIFGWWLNETVG